MVPKGWGKIKLGSVAELQRGFDLPSSQRIDGAVPVVSSGGVTGYHSEAKSKAPGVVTGRYGSIGDVFYLEEDYWPLNTSLWVKDFHGNHEKFVYYLLCNFDFKKFSDKTGVPGINRNDLHAVKVGLPSIPEQKKIAKILSTWDKAITTTEQLLANSQQQKKALMQQLLTGKKRLLDKNGARFSREWKATSLSKMGKIVSGGTPDTNTKEFWGGEIQWLTPTDVTALKSRFVSKTFRTISDLGVKNSSATLLPKGSLMVCTRATIGALAISTTDICTNQGFKNIIPSKDFDVEFIYYLLSFFSKELLRKASGSTFLELSKKDFEKIEMLCPSLKEQQKIAAVLSTADQEITALQQKFDALKQEKKALMQQLLTGKRRVKTGEAA